ncbi:MAG: dihydroorotase [bacterium]|nr:dihydroorotase [bacterium]
MHNYLLIKNGRVIDPANDIDANVDILIEDGVIDLVAPNIFQKDVTLIDASNLIIMPGLIDVHTHFREPGEEQKEDIYTGSRAALAGGFTSVICEPNTKPRIDNSDILKKVIARGKEVGLINLYSSACITTDDKHSQLSNMRKLKDSGATMFTDDGDPVIYSELMLNALIEAKKNKIMLSPHCESSGWAEPITGKLKEEPEIFYVKRDIALVEKTNTSLHFAHISLEESLNAIRIAKSKGLNITCEVTPHHLVLDKSLEKKYGTLAKVNPALRKISDVKALQDGLLDGTIDVIASDHAPHTKADKDLIWEKAACGMIGIETSLGVLLSELVHKNIIPLNTLIAKLTCNPARIFNLPAGHLAPSMPADITIIDLNKEWIVDANKFESKSRNCPFDKWKLKGKPVMTIVKGKIRMKDGVIL